MQSSPRFHTVLASRFSPLSSLRTSFRRRRPSSTSRPTSSLRNSTCSADLSPASTINSIVLRQPSVLDLEEERRSFAPGLDMLEPRPVVYWGSLEERMGSF